VRHHSIETSTFLGVGDFLSGVTKETRQSREAESVRIAEGNKSRIEDDEEGGASNFRH
jgi:hypothetical protein